MLDLSTAYDGVSRRPPRRELEPLERDILCRILSDIIHELRATHDLDALMFIRGRGGIRMDVDEIPLLNSIYIAINPRPDGE